MGWFKRPGHNLFLNTILNVFCEEWDIHIILINDKSLCDILFKLSFSLFTLKATFHSYVNPFSVYIENINHLVNVRSTWINFLAEKHKQKMWKFCFQKIFLRKKSPVLFKRFLEVRKEMKLYMVVLNDINIFLLFKKIYE